MWTTIVLVALGCYLWMLYALASAWQMRRLSLQRISGGQEESATAVGVEPALTEGWLSRWLFSAGFRHPGAPQRFLAATGAAALCGAAAAQLARSTVVDAMVASVSNLPGAGDALAAILQAGPWTIFVIVALIPTLVVRGARQRRVRDIEHDLPIVLELFATLAEAGLGLDAALSRIVRSQRTDRPLTSEFAAFQRDVLAGMPRFQALRQLARRIDVTSVTIFVSAVIQAEQIGASIAETLRHQADDLRERRRERALLLAQALPVKLVFPLVACFLPGIFISTLGPVMYQMIQVADSVLRPAAR